MVNIASMLRDVALAIGNEDIEKGLLKLAKRVALLEDVAAALEKEGESIAAWPAVRAALDAHLAAQWIPTVGAFARLVGGGPPVTIVRMYGDGEFFSGWVDVKTRSGALARIPRSSLREEVFE